MGGHPATVTDAGALPPLFSCAKRNLRLTAAGCSRAYTAASGAVAPPPWSGTLKCRHCPVGAAHAGADPAQAVFAAARDGVCAVCARCGRRGRLIAGMRCVSCYNRHREALAGRNAKGTWPRLAGLLHQVELVVLTASGVRPATVANVTSAAEAAQLLARRATGPLVIARPPVSVLAHEP